MSGIARDEIGDVLEVGDGAASPIETGQVASAGQLGVPGWKRWATIPGARLLKVWRSLGNELRTGVWIWPMED